MKFVPTPMSARPSYAEAWQIAKAIRPRFAEYMTQYDTKKYWPVVYERVRREFRQPERMALARCGTRCYGSTVISISRRSLQPTSC